MNKNRRKEIDDLADELRNLSARIEEVKFEEEEYLECMPENLQQSEKAEAAEQAIDQLDSAQASVDEAVEYMEEAGQ